MAEKQLIAQTKNIERTKNTGYNINDTMTTSVFLNPKHFPERSNTSIYPSYKQDFHMRHSVTMKHSFGKSYSADYAT